MRIIVCGGRDFRDAPKLWAFLDGLMQQKKITCVIDGASDDVTGPYVGADYWGHQWAIARNVDTVRCHADWKTEGRAAGPLRNARMLSKHSPDAVVATNGGRGTADMINKAKAAGLALWRVE
jgi:YspA, cpYpsA-related SLOG family